MSAETMETLNLFTLIGYTDKRGNAWHYREELQGDESNHYPGAIPEADVLRRLFNWYAVEIPLRYTFENKRRETDRKLIVRSDNGDLLGVFKSGYQGHEYREWLLDNVANILDDSLQIGSAGLLKNGAQAFVTVEMAENFTTPEGVEFRPHLLASTSFDGTIATTYKRVVTVVVCDNTLAAALGENGQTYKLKHTKYSGMKLGDARDALAIVHSMADDFAAEIAELTSKKVSDNQFEKLLDIVVPIPESKNGETRANKKREELVNLYRNDERAAQWNGTAFGVLQTFNTWNQHFAQVKKGVPRHVRNMENIVKDKFADLDTALLDALATATK